MDAKNFLEHFLRITILPADPMQIMQIYKFLSAKFKIRLNFLLVKRTRVKKFLYYYAIAMVLYNSNYYPFWVNLYFAGGMPGENWSEISI